MQKLSADNAPFKLDTNENQYGPSPKIFNCAQDALTKLHLYPDQHYLSLKTTLAHFLSITSQQITVGTGSEHILELITKTFLKPGTNAIVSQYSFITIQRLIQDSGAAMRIVAATHYGHDLKKMAASVDTNTRAMFLVNPNNPTGTYYNAQEFDWLMQTVPKHVLVVIDEAYYEYMIAPDYPKTISYLVAHPNLIITRTFSKAYALAGLRLGFALSTSEMAAKLEKNRLPYPVNQLAAHLAECVLSDQAHLKNVIAFNLAGKNQLELGFNALGIRYIESFGNFISIEVPDAQQLYSALLNRNIIVKTLHHYDLPHHLRITIGTAEQNASLLSSLQKIALSTPLR